jgi:hypothetical protein
MVMQALGMQPTGVEGVSVRDVWTHKNSSAPIARGGSLNFNAVAG